MPQKPLFSPVAGFLEFSGATLAGILGELITALMGVLRGVD